MCNVCIAEKMLKDEFEICGYYLRAKGKPEFGPARLQIRTKNEKYGKNWFYTYDLAGTITHLDLDKKNNNAKYYLKKLYLDLKNSSIYSNWI